MTEHQQLTQEILIQSATWWMDNDEKVAFLTQVILAIAAKTASSIEGN